jgi:outer membrane immunogenic protein
MKNAFLAFGIVTALLGTSSAMAADVVTPAAFDWSGFYAGAQVGAAFSRPNEQGSSSLPAVANEFTGGLNAQVLKQHNHLVFGAIVDGNLSTALASQTCPNVTRTCQDGSGGDFSLRGKLGFAANKFMFFGTGGWGWADYQKNSFVTANGSAPLNDRRLLSGWVAGAGISYAVNPHWIANVEYLHYDLGSANT